MKIMKVADFAIEVSEEIGDEKLTLAQIKKVVKAIDNLTSGGFYKEIRNM